MKTLVVGASGATGKQLVEQLLNYGQEVKIIIRSTSNIPKHWRQNQKISIIEASISELSPDELASHLKDCQAAASCLGHNLNLRGIYGKPRKLVTNAVIELCRAIKMNSPDSTIKFVLMNTTGNRNRDLNEPRSFGERLVIGLLRVLLPPQPDNEKAADYLRVKIGQNDKMIEWVAVRPDSLTDEEEVTDYSLHNSPTRSPVFNSGQTSRINVGNFMARLIAENDLWETWKGKMPVIYNKEQN